MNRGARAWEDAGGVSAAVAAHDGVWQLTPRRQLAPYAPYVLLAAADTMANPGIIPTVLTAIGMVAAVLLGVWAIMARHDERVRDRIDAQGKETTEQLGQLRERMAKLEGLLEGLREAITGKRAAWAKTDTDEPATCA